MKKSKLNRFLSGAVAAACALAFSTSSFAGQEKEELLKVGGKGKIAFVNAAGVDDALLKTAAERISNTFQINTEIQKGSWSLAEARKQFAATKANVAVFLVNEKTMPMSLVAIEERWGMANAAGLDDACITKQALRVATLVLGGASSRYPASVMRHVFSPEDLKNKAGSALTVDAMMAIAPNLADLGIEEFMFLDYESALDEGVAPEPANENQRRIKANWEKAKKNAPKK